MASPDFETDFEPAHGSTVQLAPDIQRITAPNSGPLTFHGTNSYIVGKGSVAVIDPGPEIESHYQALKETLTGREVTHIMVSHTHRDHSPLARRLASETGATIVAEGEHRSARPLFTGEINPLKESADTEFQPDVKAGDGDIFQGDGWALRVINTPGHTANHAVFGLEDRDIVFSADHVMVWATSIVAPPDGSMADYMRSLDKMLERDDRMYLPGHGGPVKEPTKFVRALRTHRKMREAAVLDRLQKGDRHIDEMVKAIYRDTDPRLHRAAALSLLAHLEDLVARGRVETDGAPSIDGVYMPN
ncbi:MBL fold metallo-hydrolase [Hoeflea prorocentri]|uniref:MBL fold metallo-hydrolase n=1 Tax=Hoeflea prorocentri TaxID=1922333 RepID=A0A9X3ZHB7_9HYPH|nr:MBL fold metallo-hydrolase [Hoeflea prorocentri]MCY6381627.1 MBL fold metallo-hydrolase [Hoeflea prorocentri]MDA5399427.1 MBL fold metallo-hydrolase [Hoeflea prorocentri]